jgi:anti-sigma B factor antagonist
MSLDIGGRQIHDVSVVYVRGRITFGDGTREFRDALDRLAREGYRKILLDLGEVSHLDSSGLGVLVSALSAMARHGAQLKLLNVSARVADLLLTTRLFSVFEVFDDEASALDSFEKSKQLRRNEPREAPA